MFEHLFLRAIYALHSVAKTASQRAAISPAFSADQGRSARTLMPMPQTDPLTGHLYMSLNRITRHVLFM